MSLEAFFLPAATGQRFCLLHTPHPQQTVRGGLLYLHPFAEELNYSRRIAALQARDFAAAGYLVLQIDLHGCGDSSGDFSQATWENWLRDVQLGLDYLAPQVDGNLWLWGMRAGCLLAAQAAQRRQEALNLLFWQPVLDGAQVVRHFLRLKLVGEALAGVKKETALALRQRLADGEALEIAGYLLSPTLACELEAAEWPGDLSARRIECIEISGAATPALSPLLAARLASWQAAGHAARAVAVAGPAFWQTPGVIDVPALRQASCFFVADAVAGAVAGEGR